jgi:hypothetical protein
MRPSNYEFRNSYLWDIIKIEDFAMKHGRASHLIISLRPFVLNLIP